MIKMFPFFSISANVVGLFGPVNAVNKLSRHKVTQVLHSVRSGVYVVVSSFSVMTEAVCVLHTQVQTLDSKQVRRKASLRVSLKRQTINLCLKRMSLAHLQHD